MTTQLKTNALSAVAKAQRPTAASRWHTLTPYLFLLPALALFAVYVIAPIFQSIWISFFEWDGIGDKTFIGLGNYAELLEDPQFWTSLWNNVLWLVFFMLAVPIGLGVALFLNQQVLGIRAVKSLFFFPFVISQVIVGVVFSWFYDPSYGLLQRFLGFFGVDPIPILASETLVTYGIIAAGLWPQIAYTMILYLTGLNNLNPDQIEAARMDGAHGWTMLWKVIIPQLRPATFIAMVVTVIGALRSFDLVATMTSGGPWGSSSVLAFFMYEQAIFSYRMGYGAAIATVLFLIMLVYIGFFLWRMLRAERG
ncbi:carbohydrate ABC transporter permease [Saccharospirillum salsuginis]|uniref:ABC transporter permease n=1 Tax=Saccharospirillum salsuginis TaxID=418750 RepID=A0A918KMN9_9GAMM|nr:sugar ABC transporter permease [Saccharospirillum salsuginis]GGX66885.1 ABC transporter permease [Saccharospirillum salsuginis]